MNSLVCPACGHEQFQQTRTTRTEFLMEFSAHYGWIDVAEIVIDGGDMADHDIVCADCGTSTDNDGDLVTQEEYDTATLLEEDES
jgi:DNA-directed RNA polymerase subunit RPC12/RpoP